MMLRVVYGSMGRTGGEGNRSIASIGGPTGSGQAVRRFTRPRALCVEMSALTLCSRASIVLIAAILRINAPSASSAAFRFCRARMARWSRRGVTIGFGPERVVDAALAVVATPTRCRRGTICKCGRRLLLHAVVTGHDSRDMNKSTRPPVLRIRVVFGDAGMIGPGKAELLERIDRCGSIAAAGRDMSMSYKRAWQLIGTLNAMFREPLVDSTRGGPGGGGAVLTETGRTVLSLYRAFERDAAEAGSERLNDLQAMLRDIPEQK